MQMGDMFLASSLMQNTLIALAKTSCPGAQDCCMRELICTFLHQDAPSYQHMEHPTSN